MVLEIHPRLFFDTDRISTTEAFNFTSFQGALYKADKVSLSSNTPNVTIIVPRNEAFTVLGPAISNMTSDEIATVLDYHLVRQIVYSTDLTNGSKFDTQQGGKISILQAGNNKYINSAQLLTSDILIANGVLHVIDNVLNPQGPGAQPNPVIASQAPVYASASEVHDLPFTSAIPCTESCPVTSTATSATTQPTSLKAQSTSTSMSTRSSRAIAPAMAKETGLHAAGLLVALGGAVFMI
jgi:transforming growth factor-beta-induced protein